LRGTPTSAPTTFLGTLGTTGFGNSKPIPMRSATS
jgi:hypothetical protein